MMLLGVVERYIILEQEICKVGSHVVDSSR